MKTSFRPTMDDVAAEAGVSQMTVSRVMRGAGKTSPAVRAKVEAAATKLGYSHNRVASALRDDTTPLVGVVLPTLGNRVFAEVLDGLNEVLATAQLRPLFGVTEYAPDQEEALVRDLLAWRPRGIVLPGLEHTDATRAALTAARVRVAEVMDIDGPPVEAAFGLSQSGAGRATARHLLEKGYRRFAYLGSQGGRDLRATKRFEAFRDTVRAAGGQMLSSHVSDTPSSMIEGRRLTAQLLAGPTPPEAIYFSNDDLAAGGLMHCMAEGIDVPGQVALAGFNGLAFLESLPIRLTTVETPRAEMGRAAARHLSGPAPQGTGPLKVDLGFTLIPGQSS